MTGRRHLASIFSFWCFVVGLFQTALAGHSEELLPPGFRPLPTGTHALIATKVVWKPGEELSNAIILIRNGRIESVGTNIAIPSDARIWQLKGATVYAGFIETYLMPDGAVAPVSTTDAFPVSHQSYAAGGSGFFGAPGGGTENIPVSSANPRIKPQFRSIDSLPKNESLRALREIGFTSGLAVPAKGIIRGTSSLISLSDPVDVRAVLKSDLFQHIALDTSDNETGAYPASLMGVIACIRQTLFDAQHYARVRNADLNSVRKRPEFNPALQALAPVIERKQPVMFEPGSVLMNDRAARIAREFQLSFAVVSSGEEWRRPDLLNGIAATFVVPVNFPSAPKLPNEEDWIQVSLDQLRAWDWAAENPAVLRRANRDIALTTYGLSDKKSFRKNLQLAIDRGLSEQDALAALTTVPAKLCGAEELLGTIEAGKLANLVVVSGSYFNPDSKVVAVWIEGRMYRVGDEDSKIAESETAAKPTEPDATPAKEEPEIHLRPPGAVADTVDSASTNRVAEVQTNDASKNPRARELQKQRVARILLAERGPITNPPSLLIRNAVIWTCGPEGILTNANMLVSGGRIQQVGFFKAEPGPDTMVIDAAGLHLTPGIVDCHSHAAILGDGNETGWPSTSMVRISDVLNSESESLYRQLAGGVTTINLLHGSANPIGGQNCVIKLRDGAAPEDLIFEQAPAGIKFALGENVKQSNWGEKFTTRFPQTRMGVRAFVQNRFVAARRYLQEWDAYRASRNSGLADAIEPRRDLELEAIGEILRGQRWIHCHAYRQDEMLMLTRLMQEFGVQIGTFQHALDAYKIADELAAAGIGVSAFSDWWGFKYELFDAIPFNGSLNRERGVLVSFHSDFSELARRLYVEAGKAMKYGGTSPDEALKFVTLNPAIQLRIDSHVGSLEPGKDADFVLWSKSPLDTGTVCLQTWIDGKKYFDREHDRQRTERLKQEHADLIAKVKKAASDGAAKNSGASGGKSFFSVSLEHQHEGEWRCLHE
jgi:Imidazolonepropionase and related amidohydrolases